MIKRLNLTEDSPGRDEWSADDNRFRRRQLFDGRKPYRKLLVMVDFELLEDTRPNIRPTMGQLLTELLRDSLIVTVRYSDDGPPPDVIPWPDKNVYTGWAIITDSSSDDGISVVISTSPDAYTRSTVIGNRGTIAASDYMSNVYADLDGPSSANRRRADGLATQVAIQVVNADLYITERPYLHSANTGLGRGVTHCTTRDALAILGMYFRAQGEFPVADSFKMNRGHYYWVGTRELLSEGWRWFTACVQHSKAVEDDSLMVLAGSLLQRFDRALESRDQIHIAVNQSRGNDTLDAALASLDIVLLLLMGAIDVAARVAHRVLKLSDSSEHLAGWQKQKWIQQVQRKAPKLAAVVNRDTAGDQTLNILRLLRNSVHGATLQGLTSMNGEHKREILFGIPKRDETKVVAAMKALGGIQTWGAKTDLMGQVHVEPGAFADRLFEVVIHLLNELMLHTPVEELDYVNLKPADCVAPHREPLDPFSPWIRQSIRWQLGF